MEENANHPPSGLVRPPDPTTPSPEQASTEPIRRVRPGPRPIEETEEPQQGRSKRTLSNRQAQRAHRQRRQEYIEDLERKVAQLQSAGEREKRLAEENRVLVMRIAELETEKGAALAEVAELKSRLLKESMSESPEPWTEVAGMDSVLHKGKSAVELFGPMDTDSTRDALQSLESLRNSKWVDEFLGLFVTQSHFADKKTIKSMYKRIIAARYNLLDACSLLDRQKAIEYIEVFKSKNRMHFNHLHLNSTHDSRKLLPAAPVTDVEVDSHLQPFREAVLSIPSLRGANELIDELVQQFSSQHQCVDKLEREERFFSLFEISSKLQSLCASDEDRTKFMLAMELARSGNKKMMDEWVKDVQ